MQDRKLAIKLLKEKINKFVKCEDGYKYLKSERRTYTISLENRSCTCVRFENFSMCHHLVAVAMAEGKELRGLDLSKVLVSKQRKKLNKKNEEINLYESMLQLLEDSRNEKNQSIDEIEIETFEFPQQQLEVPVIQQKRKRGDVESEPSDLQQQTTTMPQLPEQQQQPEVIVTQPKKKRGRPAGSKNKDKNPNPNPNTQPLQVPQFIQNSYRGQLRSAKRALDRY